MLHLLHLLGLEANLVARNTALSAVAAPSAARGRWRQAVEAFAACGAEADARCEGCRVRRRGEKEDPPRQRPVQDHPHMGNMEPKQADEADGRSRNP